MILRDARAGAEAVYWIKVSVGCRMKPISMVLGLHLGLHLHDIAAQNAPVCAPQQKSMWTISATHRTGRGAQEAGRASHFSYSWKGSWKGGAELSKLRAYIQILHAMCAQNSTFLMRSNTFVDSVFTFLQDPIEDVLQTSNVVWWTFSLQGKPLQGKWGYPTNSNQHILHHGACCINTNKSC